MPTFDEIARQQRGYADNAQMRAAGLSQRTINRLVREGHFQRPDPGVYLTGSAPPDWEDRVVGAVLAAGGDARAMGRTAARLHGLDGAENHGIIELTVSIHRGPRPKGVRIHVTRQQDPSLTGRINGIPVSAVNQTLLEYAWLVRATPPVERAVEDKRPEGRPARSGFEVIVLDILRDAGLPLPVRRPLVAIPPDYKFELDLAYMDLLIDIEPMGAKWHSTASQRRQDAERRKVLESVGWLIVPVDWHEAVFMPEVTVARVRAARSARM